MYLLHELLKGPLHYYKVSLYATLRETFYEGKDKEEWLQTVRGQV